MLRKLVVGRHLKVVVLVANSLDQQTLIRFAGNDDRARVSARQKITSRIKSQATLKGFGIGGMAFGWFVYSRFIATRIFKLDPDFITPAHQFRDNVDYVPTNRFVLWGHHFTSVAGAAPI